MRYLRLALCAALLFTPALLVSFTAPVHAATTGLVRGTVTANGAPANGAQVTLVGEGSKFTTTTNSQGQYSFAAVPFGNYELTAHYQSLPNGSVNLTVSSDTVSTIDVALSAHLKMIGKVAANAAAGTSGTPVAVNQISKSQIQTSPLQDSLNRLIETLPGIVQFSYNEPVALGFHGVTYELDGAPLPLATSSNFAEVVDPKQIDSLEVYTGDFPAEYGGSRMGAVVNIITSRPSDIPQGLYGQITAGGGNYAQSLGQLTEEGRFGSTEVFFNYDSSATDRGIDAPTIDAFHDNSSQSDGFLRVITQINPRSSLSFDYSNQFSQFQIPINTDPNDPLDPQVAPANTDDVQREYDRFASANYTLTSKDGEGIFQIVPWYRSTDIAYAGDLANDVQSTITLNGTTCNLIGLDQNRFASYAGLRLSDFRASEHHAWKIGVDLDRENFNATQTFACYNVDCDTSMAEAIPYYAVSTAQNQPGTNVGIYAEDKWQPSKQITFDYGLRYDHSTGYVGGWQISPRIGVNIQANPTNIIHMYYGRMYAAPQLEDVREDCVLLGAATGGCPANPVYDLQPERDDYFELGLQHTYNSRLTGYFNYDQRRVINVLDTTQLLSTPIFAVFNNALGEYEGIEAHFEDRAVNGNYWSLSTTVSRSEAGGISGSTFLFPTGVNPPGVPLTSPSLLSPEDHDQTVAVKTGYTALFGQNRQWFSTLEADYGTGYPVAFENATTSLCGRLPVHTTFNVSIGRSLQPATKSGLGIKLDVVNLLNDQYIIKIANGFNTTQFAAGRSILLRLTAPF